MMNRVFKLKDFDGPLDLLLTLIDRAQISIQEIFVSEITGHRPERAGPGYGRGE